MVSGYGFGIISVGPPMPLLHVSMAESLLPGTTEAPATALALSHHIQPSESLFAEQVANINHNLFSITIFGIFENQQSTWAVKQPAGLVAGNSTAQ